MHTLRDAAPLCVDTDVVVDPRPQELLQSEAEPTDTEGIQQEGKSRPTMSAAHVTRSITSGHV